MSGLSLEDWFLKQRGNSDMQVETINLKSCTPWRIQNGTLSRPDGRFFSIFQSDSLYIDQPEIGLLSFVLVENTSEPRIIVQAKDEPGNIGFTQLAPTVQATLSNFSQVHGGLATKYLDSAHPEFTEAEVISDSLQSEHGSRFWKKRNRNVIVSTAVEPQLEQNYFLSPVSELLKLLTRDFAVNTDSRSVLVCSPWNRLVSKDKAPFKNEESNKWSNRLAISYNGTAKGFENAQAMLARIRSNQSASGGPPLVPFDNSTENSSIITNKNQHINFVRVTSGSREVANWNQPLFRVDGEDAQILLSRNTIDSIEFLLRAKPEPGLRSSVEFCVTREINNQPGVIKPDLSPGSVNDWIENQIETAETILQVRQSDEGGRFNQAISTYKICLLQDQEGARPAEIDFEAEGYVWVNLRAIQKLVLISETTTNELRSAISLLLSQL